MYFTLLVSSFTHFSIAKFSKFESVKNIIMYIYIYSQRDEVGFTVKDSNLVII